VSDLAWDITMHSQPTHLLLASSRESSCSCTVLLARARGHPVAARPTGATPRLLLSLLFEELPGIQAIIDDATYQQLIRVAKAKGEAVVAEACCIDPDSVR
jgi:hypothetical protein